MYSDCLIGASVSGPHNGELAGGFSICVCIYIWVYMYVRYVHDSVYLYDLFKWHPARGLGMRSTATRPGYEAWVRGQEHISCCTWHIIELNYKILIEKRD